MIKGYLHNSSDHRILGIIRSGIFSIWLIKILNAPIHNYSLLPPESFSPWGFHQTLFSIIPGETLHQFILSYGFLIGFKYILAICCFLCLLGFRPWKPLALCTSVMVILLDGIIQGFYGFANHAQLGIQYCIIILAIFPSSDGWSIMGETTTKSSNNLYKAPVLLCTLALCAPYMFIGTHRLLYGGVKLFTSEAILHHISVRDLQYAEHNINLNFTFLDHPSIFPVLKTGFFVTTVFEILTPLTLLNHRFRYTWLIIIIPFHLFTLITMNIFFWENLILIILLLTEWPYFIDNFSYKKVFQLFFTFH